MNPEGKPKEGGIGRGRQQDLDKALPKLEERKKIEGFGAFPGMTAPEGGGWFGGGVGKFLDDLEVRITKIPTTLKEGSRKNLLAGGIDVGAQLEHAFRLR